MRSGDDAREQGRVGRNTAISLRRHRHVDDVEKLSGVIDDSDRAVRARIGSEDGPAHRCLQRRRRTNVSASLVMARPQAQATSSVSNSTEPWRLFGCDCWAKALTFRAVYLNSPHDPDHRKWSGVSFRSRCHLRRSLAGRGLARPLAAQQSRRRPRVRPKLARSA